MTIALLIAGILLTPRQAEVFSGTPMEKVSNLIPTAIVVPIVDRATNTLTWTASWDATGYRIYQFSGVITNTYSTSNTQMTIVYDWPVGINRWFYFVIATNDWGESDPSNQVHFPPYAPDRVELFVNGQTNFVLETSTDRKTWIKSTVIGRVTISLTIPQQYFRVNGMTNALCFYAFNPLNK